MYPVVVARRQVRHPSSPSRTAHRVRPRWLIFGGFPVGKWDRKWSSRGKYLSYLWPVAKSQTGASDPIGTPHVVSNGTTLEYMVSSPLESVCLSYPCCRCDIFCPLQCLDASPSSCEGVMGISTIIL